MIQAPENTTVGGLHELGYTAIPLRDEIRANLLAKLAAGEDPWPGLHGFDDTVVPQVERALIAGHDIVLLGERGQARRACCEPWSACSTRGPRSSRAPSWGSTPSTRSRRPHDAGRAS